MQLHRNATHAPEAAVECLVRTRYTLVVCVVCGHEHIKAAWHETSCPECGATARRSFALFRDLREQR
jgi:rubrerythrin